MLLAREPVTIHYSGSRALVVQITTPTQLSTVLQTLCTSTPIDCELPAADSSDSIVAPMTVKGTWEQVLQTLLQGTGLDFVTFAPIPPHRGRLILRLATAKTSGAIPAPVSTSENSSAGADRSSATPDELPQDFAGNPSSSPMEESEPASGPTLTGHMNTGSFGFSSPGLQVTGTARVPLSGVPSTSGGVSGLPLPGIISSPSSIAGPPLPMAIPSESSSRGSAPLPIAQQ